MFKFNLEPVLNHRKFQEEDLQKEVSIFKKLLVDEKKKMLNYKNAKTKLLKRLQEKKRGSISVSEILLHISFIDRVSADLESQRERILNIEKKVDLKRADLVATMKKRKILEELKNKSWKSHKQDLEKNEQIFFDEVGINKFNAGGKTPFIEKRVK